MQLSTQKKLPVVTDVLIVGAGPAGSAAATVCARAGLRVTLLDRAKFPRPKVCGDALSNKAIALIERLGAGDALRHAAHRDVLGALAMLPDGSAIPRDYGNARGMIVGRFDLDALLLQTAISTGAVFHEHCAVDEIIREKNVVVGVRSSRGELRARAVISAEGPGSLALRALGLQRPKGRHLAISSTAYYKNVSGALREGWSEHWFDASLPYGYGWIFPSVEGISNVGVYLRCDGYDAQKLSLSKRFDLFLEQHRDRFAHAQRIGDVRTWQLPLSDVSVRVGMAGMLTVGDAGRHVDPLTGEGIWQALRTGELAGEACVNALRNGALDDNAVKQYRWRVAREVDVPATLRGRIQDGMQTVVASGLYRSRAVQQMLRWGYGSGVLEVSKTVG
jgi:menaquinone-9 beta-reductase